jgi:hypothetical protein
LALVSHIKDAHSVLSKALALHYFTPTSLKSNSTSSIHLNLGLLLFFLLLFCLPLTSLLSSHHLFLQHAQAIEIYVFYCIFSNLICTLFKVSEG